MIERIELRNFKSHVHTAVDLGRLTLLVGPNSSGKTSLLEALHLLCSRYDCRKDNLFGDFIRAGEDTSSTEVHSTFRAEEVKISTSLNRNAPDYSYKHLYRESEAVLPTAMTQGLIKEVKRTVHLKLSPRRLAAPYYSEDIPPKVGNFGDGLAPALAYLLTYEPERFQDLMSLVRSVLPFVKAIRVRPAKVHRPSQKILSVDDKSVPIDTSLDVVGHEMLLDVDGARGVPSHAVSDGTLLTIGLLTILTGPSCPYLILLDDIEQGLHPKAQRELVGVLKRLLEKRPELQIVATTHSPYVVDELDASDVWVLAANPAGETTARRLSDHPDAKKALEVLTTGEFLSAEGEDWVLEATPADA